MKRPIIPALATILTLAVLPFLGKSADLIVEENASAHNYGSIVEAVDSAQDGDRIIVKNRTSGGAPWTFQQTNQLTIDKSLTFLSFANDTFFRVEGDITIEHDTGREVTINGMRIVNTGGNQSGGSISGDFGGSGGFTQVNIVNCYLESGNLDFDRDYFRLRAAGNELDDGGIDFSYGQIIGNEIDNTTATCLDLTSSTASLVDTALIMGNKMDSDDNVMLLDSDAVYYHVRNNFIDAGGSFEQGIDIDDTPNSSTKHLIYNNTIDNCDEGIDIASSVSNNAVFEVINNVVGDEESGVDGVINNNPSASVFAFYNYIDDGFNNGIGANITTASDNVTGQTISINFDGTLVGSSPAIDGAYPSSEFADFDPISRGDAGAYGGSYTLDNFFPLFNGSARVYNVRSPFKVKQGNSFTIEGDSYDR